MQSIFYARRLWLFAASLGWAGSVAAFDGFSLETGSGHDGVKIVRLSTLIRQWERPQKKEKTAAELQVFWELGLAYWQAAERTGVRDLFDVSATPVFRFSSRRLAPRVYADLGIGVHVLSDNEIGERELSTPYHFGSLAGLGIEWGEGRYDLGFHIQHLSNASVDLPNPGINFSLLRFAVRY